MKPLAQSFFERPTLDVARDLMGCELLVFRGRSVCGGRLVEVEAYIGEEDPACHAHRGRTRRNATMYGSAGHAYVYFTYGNHWMLNFVTEREGFPAAVLIRGLEPVSGIPLMRRRRGLNDPAALASGPGKLTQAMGVTGDDNGLSLQGPRLIVTGGRLQSTEQVITSGRIGVNEGHDRPWRFFVAGHPCVSKYRNGAPQVMKLTGAL